MVFCLENNEPRRRLRSTMVHFQASEVQQLLHNKFVVILGDSIQRAVYKDLVLLLQKDSLLTAAQLKAKGELSFEQDQLVAGGQLGELHNGTQYREVRQFCSGSGHHLVRFYFLTRVYSEYLEGVLEELTCGPAPDLVIINSCLWDLSRYGRCSMEAYRENLERVFVRMDQVLPDSCLLVWNMAMPLGERVTGGFLLPELQPLAGSLRRDVVEGNFYSATLAGDHCFDVLDLHFHFRHAVRHRHRDGIHWDQHAHRHLSHLLLTHVADAWGVELPKRDYPPDPWIEDWPEPDHLFRGSQGQPPDFGNANQPLLTPKTDEVDNLAQQEQDVLYRRLKLFTHLRQDLERVRNLCYMVTRRERTKHAICKLQEQIFHLQMKLIEQDLCRERSGRRAKGKKSDSKRKAREGPKGSPEKKERAKAGPDSVLGQLGLSTSFPIDGTFFNSWLAQSVQITAENMAMSEWSLNNGHREDPAPGLLSEELLQDEETLLSFMRDPSLRPGDPARKARGRARLPTKKKLPQDGPGSRTTPDKPPKKPWGQDPGSGKGGQGPPARKPPRRTPSHLPSSPTAGDCPIPAAPERPPPLAPETPDEATPTAPDANVQVPGPTASPKPPGRLRPPRESKGTRRSPGARPDAGTGPPSAVAERPKVSLHFDTETDGYFSDGELSDSDVEAEDSEVQRAPREAGAEEVVRMGVLAS